MTLGMQTQEDFAIRAATFFDSSSSPSCRTASSFKWNNPPRTNGFRVFQSNQIRASTTSEHNPRKFITSTFASHLSVLEVPFWTALFQVSRHITETHRKDFLLKGGVTGAYAVPLQYAGFRPYRLTMFFLRRYLDQGHQGQLLLAYGNHPTLWRSVSSCWGKHSTITVNELLNSDDYDLGEAPAGRYAALGKRSIADMLENATGNRFESKKMSKHLRLMHKSPNVKYHMELWHAWLTTFIHDTLVVKK
ncbi:hypothetical protein CC78DRAFT_579979 [Lojkania enalia]|uniref:Uncharacterized protein n=1 Tax=Lojkania enalia TaxID=147567 RepID=A0A9P4KAJ7_9PLEO|nr:hypothetical protein CC78DRAFT_579979 [Didymosphaeria enalia]